MNRIEWIIEKFGRSLLAAAVITHGEIYPSAKCAVEQILRGDPTPNKKFARWLVDAYMRGDYLIEDCEKAQETLSLFQVYSRRLDSKERDIGQHKSIADIWKLIRQFVEIPDELLSGKEHRRAERDQARRESLILLDEAETAVAIPLTRYAAIWWGRGTRWCTSMENADHFSNYQKAPLFIIVSKGIKFQAYSYEGTVTLMDNCDAPIGKTDREHLKESVPELMEWLARDSNDPELMPVDRMDYEFLKTTIRENGFAIRHLLPHLLDKELYMEAIRSFPSAIAIIPEELIDVDMCLLALQSDGLSFPYLPARFQTKELLLTGMQDCGYLLDLIPEAGRSREYCEIAIRTGVVNLECIPARHWDQELARLVMRHVNESLLFIRERWPQFMDRVLESVLTGGSAFYNPLWTQTHFRDEEMCVIAIRNNKDAWKYVPREMRSDELLCALKSRGNYHSFSTGMGRDDRQETCQVTKRWDTSAEMVAAVEKIFANRNGRRVK